MGKRPDKKHQQRFQWQKTLGTMVMALGAMVSLGSPSEAVEPIHDSFELAQVGVTSRIKPPTPLNLTPRTHIPLPKSNYHRRHDHGGYYPQSGSSPNADYRRPRRDHYRSRDGYNRHKDYDHNNRRRSQRHSHRHTEDYNHSSHRQSDRRGNSRVIIINPNGQGRYNNSKNHDSRSYNSGSYIRIIGR